MGTFGFIENFFFISLALVFVLVLLLVYHFKNRITIAEKKSESMYGLLTAVVKEIKSLRGMFGGPVNEQKQTHSEPSNFEVKSKTVPEVNVLSGGVVESVQEKEVINLDFSASEDKIVVSDGSDSDSCSDDDSDSDESDIGDGDDNDNEGHPLDVDIIVSEHPDTTLSSENTSSTLEEIDVSFDIIEPSQEILNTEVTQTNEPEEGIHDEIQDNHTPVHTMEQLRKMNINQLKMVASEVGVNTDLTKLKKHELISLIQSCSN